MDIRAKLVGSLPEGFIPAADDGTCIECGCEKSAADGAEHCRRHTARAKRRALGSIPAEIQRAMAAQSCVYCGQQATGCDHLLPVTKGGTNDLDNLVPACRRCNSSRSRRDLIGWDPERVLHAMNVSEKVRSHVIMEASTLATRVSKVRVHCAMNRQMDVLNILNGD
ncbi:HNH endonuclease [Streptomyces boninensis]|uniref:HNH endonuclease n=1 Tax=Streptomyces boninensis TaxID=2039455 RepID=UPI003B212E9B